MTNITQTVNSKFQGWLSAFFKFGSNTVKKKTKVWFRSDFVKHAVQFSSFCGLDQIKFLRVGQYITVYMEYRLGRSIDLKPHKVTSHRPS